MTIPENTNAIEIRQLQFAWQDDTPPTLDIPELDIQPGERVFIKGASGSGKSTLLSLLGGVLLPQCGQVNILGKHVNQLSSSARDRFRADHVGFIFQMFNLLPYLGVIDNVTLPLQFSPRRRQRVLQQRSPAEEALRLLEHLDLADKRILSRPTNELSVGQQQRVAAARALIGQPEIVIADEPTSSLDADRRDAFIDLLIHECQSSNSTLVFVSHDAALESHFDRRVSLNQLNLAAREH